MNFHELRETALPEPEVDREINLLLEQKMAGEEQSTCAPIAIFDQFINDELSASDALLAEGETPRPQLASKANELFLRIVKKAR